MREKSAINTDNAEFKDSKEFRRLLEEAENAFYEKDIFEARDLFTEISVKFPQFGEPWLGLSKIDFLEGRFDESARYYKKCLLAAPSIGIFQEIAAEAFEEPEKLHKMAHALYRESLYEESLKFTDKLVEMDISHEIRQNVLLLRFELNNAIKENIEKNGNETSKNRKSRSLAFKIIFFAVFAISVIGIYLIFFFYNRSFSIEAGKEAYDKAMIARQVFIDNEKDGKPAFNAFQKAEKIFKNAAAKKPKSAQTRYLLAKTYLQIDGVIKMMTLMGEPAPSGEDYAKMARLEIDAAIQADRDFPESYVERGIFRMKDRNYDGAKQDFEMAVKTASKLTADNNRREMIVQQAEILIFNSNKKIKEIKEAKEPLFNPENDKIKNSSPKTRKAKK